MFGKEATCEPHSSGLSALGMAISSILKDEEESVDRLKLFELLCDVDKCFVEVHHAQSKQGQPTYILLGVGETMRDLLENTKTDTYVFAGEEFLGENKRSNCGTIFRGGFYSSR